MSNPKGINRRAICDHCGACMRFTPCEDIRCGWRELPPRKAHSVSQGGRDATGGETNPVAVAGR